MLIEHTDQAKKERLHIYGAIRGGTISLACDPVDVVADYRFPDDLIVPLKQFVGSGDEHNGGNPDPDDASLWVDVYYDGVQQVLDKDNTTLPVPERGMYMLAKPTTADGKKYGVRYW